MAEKGGIKEPKIIDVVSQDKDWRDVVRNELRCQENWQKDWGFLADNGIEKDGTSSAKERKQGFADVQRNLFNIAIVSSDGNVQLLGGGDDQIAFPDIVNIALNSLAGFALAEVFDD